jgi:hypothetical protein
MTAFIDTNTYCQMGLLVAVIVSGFVLVAVAAVAEDMVQFSSVQLTASEVAVERIDGLESDQLLQNKQKTNLKLEKIWRLLRLVVQV